MENSPFLETPIEDDSIPNNDGELSFSEELKTLGIPVLAANALTFSVIIAPLFSLGHLGTQYLAAVALATMFCSVTGFSVGSGLTTALDTLCSQSLTGSSDKYALGKHLQRALFVQLLLCIPVIIIWNFAEPVLILFGQDIEIARIAGQFVKFLMPGLYPYLANRCLVSYLQAQGIMDAGLFIMLVAAPTNALFQWALVWAPNLNIGANGAPLATSLTNILVFALTSAYIYFVKGGDRFGGFEFKEIFDFRQIWVYIKLGIPGVIMVCSEWWAFEIVALAAGWISDEVLAAQSITLNVCTFLFYFPLGISIAANTRIGNMLGAELPITTKKIAKCSFILAVIIACMNSLFLIFSKRSLGYLFTSDKRVAELVEQVLPLAAMFQFSDGLACVGAGILRGCGRQKLGAIANLGGYYIFGLPLGIIFAFVLDLKLLGLWYGITIGIVIVSIFDLVYILKLIDWNAEVTRALKLVRTNRSTSAEQSPLLTNME